MVQRDSWSDEEESRTEDTPSGPENPKEKLVDFLRWKVALPARVWVTKNITEKIAELFTGSPTKSDRGPLLTVVRSVRTWEKIRLPLFVAVVVALLVIVGSVTSSLLTARKLEKAIVQAQDAESRGRVETLEVSTSLLSELAAEYPDHCNVQNAWVWQALLHQELLGADKKGFLKGIDQSVSRCEGTSSGVVWAARVAWLIDKGKDEKALRLCEEKAKEDPEEPRLAMACAWAKKEVGRVDDALSDLETAGRRFSRYKPLWLFASATAYENDRWAKAIPLVRELLKRSPQHLYGALLTIALALPQWGENEPSEKKVATFARNLGLLSASIEKAPPKYKMLGLFLKGRIELLSGYPDRAMMILSEVARGSEEPEYLAWYALAAQHAKGFEFALGVLKENQNIQGPLVWQLHADLLLELHRITEAKTYLEKIPENARIQDLVATDSWIASIRSGDLREAKNEMPPKIGTRLRFAALELYEQFLERGDTRGIKLLTSRMTSGLDECVDVIESWHRGNARRALVKLGVYGKRERGVCAAALATMLLPGRVDPSWLKQMADRAVAAADGNLWMRVHAAHAVWRADGLAAAVGQLEEVRALNPQGGPLRSAMARVYTLIGQPERALEILGDPQSSQELAWAIEAAREADETKRLKKLVNEAAERRKEGAKHPGLFYALLARDYQNKEYRQVSESGKAYIKEGGRWAAQIAEVAAWAFNYTGHRTDADHLLEVAFRQLPKESGLGIAWDAKIAEVRLDLRRGSNFVTRARATAAVLYRRGVKGPWISYAYGLANGNVGQNEIAVKYYNEALEIDPGFKLAFKKLDAMNLLTAEQKQKMDRVRGSR